MPSLWSGTVTFGLVSIPVRLEVSKRSQSLSFNLLHSKCLNRINQKPYCPVCEEQLERSDLVRGYQYAKDQYVVMEPEDFEKAEGQASRNIEVVAFVDTHEIQPVHIDKTYYLIPEVDAEKGYLLLLKGMQQTGRVAIARFVMRGKEYIGAVAAAPGGLMLHILFHTGEFRTMSDVFTKPDIELQEKELLLATQIIENLTEEFSDDMLEDEYRERLMSIVQQKIEGHSVVVADAPQPAKVLDLMEALKKSLEMTGATTEKEEERQRKHA